MVATSAIEIFATKTTIFWKILSFIQTVIHEPRALRASQRSKNIFRNVSEAPECLGTTYEHPILPCLKFIF